jgi:hypothetical protein
MTKIFPAKQGDIGATFRYSLVVSKPADFFGVIGFWKIVDKHTGETKSQPCLVSGSSITTTALRRSLKLQYTTVSGDLDEAGEYLQEWELVWPDGRRRTFPSGGWELLIVRKQTSGTLADTLSPLVTDDGRLILTDDGRVIWIET